MTFGPHIKNIVNNANARLNSLRSLGGTKFGKDKETLAPTYKQFIRTVLAYASPAWALALSNSNIQKLQTLQNKALRTVTGCTQRTPIEHLHAETKILLIKAYLDMRGTQFIAASINNIEYPCYYLRDHPPTHRQIVQTPHRYYTNILNTVPPPQGNTSTKKTHNYDTENSGAGRQQKVLGHPPPDISSTETQLSRLKRVHLARLRCGHHPSLQTYANRICQADTDTRPSFQRAPHTITHLLLECPLWQDLRQHHHITSALQLWSNPLSVVSYLREGGLL
jgi:hypothetical protein